MKLNEIRDNKGSHLTSKRLGRGEGSGKGKTCGRGQKGQKARSGVSINGFEGGQNPLYMRLPKRGFNNKNFRTEYAELNLSQLQAAVDKKKLDAQKEITIDTLKKAGLVRKNRKNVKILGRGELKASLNLSVTKASQAAVKAIEKAKGKITQTAVLA